MPFEEGHPTLTGCLAWIPLKNVVKKQLFGGRYLRLWDYFTMLGFQYESGAILGRARCDKLNVLVRMLMREENKVDEFMKFLQDASSDRLNRFRNEIGKDPESFYDFISLKECDRVLGGATGLTWNVLVEEYLRGNKEVVKAFAHKVSLGVATDKSRIFGLEGIGFGSSFPELTESMYKNAYENVDVGEWAEARAHGLDIPEKPEVIPFEEREESLLQVVAAYVTEYYPELLDPLDLRGHLEV